MAINRDKVLEAAQKYVEKKKFDKAVIELRKLVEADPNDARTLLKIGDLQAKQFIYADAITTYESVGKLYATQGFALKAIAVYKQIREIIAKHVPQLEERYGHIAPKLAELYQQLGLTSDALAALDEVATRLQRQQKDPEAIEVFRKIVELDPTNPLPHLRLAEALSRVKDVDGAVEEFKTAAQQLTGIGRRDDALKVLERLLHHRQDPEQARLCAELYLARGQPQDGMQALSKLQVCFQANPRDFDTLSLLARAFNAIGQGAKAIEVQKEMARVARDTGKMDLFREILERLNRVAPHDEGVRRLAAQGPSAGGAGMGATGANYGAAAMAPASEAPPPEPEPPPPPQQQPPPPQFGGYRPPAAAAPPPFAAPAPPPQRPFAEFQNEPRPVIPYIPPGPAPLPPQPNRGATQPVPRANTDQYPAAHAPTPGTYELNDEEPQEYADYEDAEVVDDEEVVEEDNAGGYADPNDPYGTGGGEYDELEQPTAETNDRFARPQQPYGFPQSNIEPAEGEAGYDDQGYGEVEQGYEDAPSSSVDTAEMVNKTLEDAAAFRRVRLYDKALEVLRAGLDVEPRSMDLHEVYRDVLIEAELTDEAVEEMLVIASLYVDSLDGDSAARALQDVLAFDPHNQRAIAMLQELGYEIVDENESAEGAELGEHGGGYGEVAEYAEEDAPQQERLPSYDLEEMGASDVAPHYADDRQVHLRGAASYDEDALGSEALPSFPLDEPEHIEAYEGDLQSLPPDELDPPPPPLPVRPVPGGRRPPPMEARVDARMNAGPSVHPESAAEIRVPPAPAFGRISMVPRSMSKPPPSLGQASVELEDALDEAEFFCSRGLFDDARAILTEQLSRHPNHPLLKERLAEVESQDAQRGSGAREKPRENDRAFELAQSLDALESLDYANIEPAEGHAGTEEQVDVEEVFAKFKEGVAKQISVDDSGAHYDLAIAYKEMGLLDDAIREFDTAARDMDRECVCRSMIGLIELERGHINEAIDAFLHGLNARIKEPQQETVLCYEIGAAYEAKKLTKDALSYYQKAMRRDPNYRDVQERVRRLAKVETKMPARQVAVGADDEFDRAFDDLLSKA